MEDQEIWHGDALTLIDKVEYNSINCCITSPPYYGLRDYKVDGQIGLEQTPDEYVANLVQVFREVRNRMTDDATLWVVIGDSYYNYRPGKGQALPKQSIASNNQDLPTENSDRDWET